MKANELRTGNFVTGKVIKEGVYQNYILKETDIIEVDSILDLKEFGGKINNVHDSWEYDLKYVYPIALNEEWLLKFGFYQTTENAGNLKCLKKGNITIALWIGNKWQVWIDSKDLKQSPQCVHQLQNLYFALTGEELTNKYPAKCY